MCQASTPFSPLIPTDLLSHFAGEMQLIDYEYASPNYAAYDIGNHFNEFAGGYCIKYWNRIIAWQIEIQPP